MGMQGFIHNQIVLPSLLREEQIWLETAAQTWLAQGASGFGLWSGNDPVAVWGTAQEDAYQDAVRAPLRNTRYKGAALRVVITPSDALYAQLLSEARMLERLMILEDDLQIMTAEFVETQDQLLALYDLTRSMRRHLTIEETMQSVAREARRLVKTEYAGLLLRLPQGFLFAHAPELRLSEAVLLQIFEQVRAHGGEAMIGAGNPLLPPATRNIMVCPMKVREAASAALVLIDKEQCDFSAPDMKLARAIADQAAAHMENVLLHYDVVQQTRMQTEMDLARHVQQNLLPRHTPVIEGLDVYGEARPAQQIGGDFFDYVDVPGKPFVFTLGDVAGKGMPAALLMSIVRTLVHNSARGLAFPVPDAILQRLHEDLYDDLNQNTSFVTVFAGMYQPGDHQLYIANAGHSPVIMRHRNQPAKLLRADSPPIGMLPDTTISCSTIPFAPGDVLVVATDGFSEASNRHDEMFGYDRLMTLIEELAELPAATIAQELFRAIDMHSGSIPQGDDRTILVVKAVA